MKYLLDTNFIIFYLKNDLGAAQFLKANQESEIYISTITHAELFYGSYKSKKQQQNLKSVEKMIDYFPSYVFSPEAAKFFGQIKAKLEQEGKVSGLFDMQIAAIALVNDCTVVTRNLSEFTRIENLKVVGY